MNGRNLVAPRALVAWEGHRLTLKAPSQRRDGRVWPFRSWSDGHARSHDMYTPTGAKVHQARYEAR